MRDTQGTVEEAKETVRDLGPPFPRAARLQSTVSEGPHCQPKEPWSEQACARSGHLQLLQAGGHMAPFQPHSHPVPGFWGLLVPWEAKHLWSLSHDLSVFLCLCVLCSSVCACEGRGLNST